MKIYSQYNDELLIELLRTSDEKAFTEIYGRYWELLYAIGYNYCREKPVAEEIVQDVFMSLWHRRTEIIIKDLPAYLATACKFSVFKHLNKLKRRSELLEEHMLPVVPDINEEDNINARFLQEYISGVIEQLPTQCKTVFLYSREKGFSNSEIASQMNISVKTVESHLTKALKTLRRFTKHFKIVLLNILPAVVTLLRHN